MTTQAQKDKMLASQTVAITDAAAYPAILSDLNAAKAKTQALPVSAPPPSGESPDPTEGLVVVDEAGARWTFDATHNCCKNTLPMYGWRGTVYYWQARILYTLGMSGAWYKLDRITGSAIACADPRPGTPPPTTQPPPTGSYDPKAYLTITDTASLNAKRGSLIQYIWAGKGKPTTRPTIALGVNPPIISSAVRCDRWTTAIPYAGQAMHTAGYVFRPATLGLKAAILMPGHNGSLSARNFDLLMRDLLAQNVTVVMHWMVLYGENYSDAGYGSHDQMSVLNSAAPFIDHYLASVNELVAQGFSRVGMLGLSGGGWASTHCAAADPRIVLSYDVAGSQPLALWPVAPAVIGGDWEQHNALGTDYSVCSYEDLYLMGGAGIGRKHTQGCNTNDLYFSGTKDDLYRPEIAARATALGGTFVIHRYTTPQPDHTLDATVRAAFVADL